MTTSPTSDAAAEGLDVGKAARRSLGFLAVLAVGVVALGALPGLGEVRDRFGGALPEWLAIALLCELGSVLSSLSPREASEFLIEKARSRARGGGDNLSLVIVKLEPLEH